MPMNEVSEREALDRLFRGVVPERFDEVSKLIDRYSAHFRLVGDSPGFSLEAGPFGAVQFTQRSLDQLWLFSFSGLQALHCYSGLLVIAHWNSLPITMRDLEDLPGQQPLMQKFGELLQKLTELRTAESGLDVDWSEGVPKPTAGRPQDTQHAAFFDLTLMATAYIFLHELKHVIFAAEGNAPDDPVVEEYECDAFARSILLDRVDEYSRNSGYPAEGVLMKRSMAIALASGFLFASTPKDRLGGSDTHPPIHRRWREALSSVDLPDNDYHWLFFCSVALALLVHGRMPLPTDKVASFKDYAIKLVGAVENGI